MNPIHEWYHDRPVRHPAITIIHVSLQSLAISIADDSLICCKEMMMDKHSSYAL